MGIILCLWLAVILTLQAATVVFAEPCNTALNLPVGGTLMVDCSQDPVELNWRANFVLSELRLDVYCPAIDHHQEITDILYEFGRERSSGTESVGGLVVGQGCTYYGCVRDEYSEVYRFENFTCRRQITSSSSSVVLATSSTATPDVTLSSILPSPSPSPSSSSPSPSPSSPSPSPSVHERTEDVSMATTDTVVPSSALAAHTENNTGLPAVSQGLLVTLVPVLLLCLAVLALVLPIFLCCLLHRRRRATTASHRLCAVQQVEMLYKLEEDHMDEGFITSTGSAHLCSASMTSLHTVLDAIRPATLSESCDHALSLERYQITLDPTLEHVPSASSQESVSCQVSNSQRVQSASPIMSLHGSSDHLTLVKLPDTMPETVWSELEMCFSDSDNEGPAAATGDREDRESKEYFRVEDLGPYANAKKCEKLESGGRGRVGGTETDAEDSGLHMAELQQFELEGERARVNWNMESFAADINSYGAADENQAGITDDFPSGSVAMHATGDSGFDSALPCNDSSEEERSM